MIAKAKSLSPETAEILQVFANMIDCMKDENAKTIARLEKQLNEQADSYTQSLEAIKAGFHSTVTQLREEIKKALDERDTEIMKNRDSFSEAVHDLKKQVSEQKYDADAQDAYTRRESLIFSGDLIPAFNPNESCPKIVRSLIRQNLTLDMDPLLSTAHRLGKPPASSNSPDKRSIIAKFIIRDDKFRVLKEARAKKIRGLYVAESLTPTRSTIFHNLRLIRKANPKVITGLHTHNGRIFLATLPSLSAPENSRSIRTEINTMERLESFCEGFLRKPLASFLSTSQMD